MYTSKHYNEIRFRSFVSVEQDHDDGRNYRDHAHIAQIQKMKFVLYKKLSRFLNLFTYSYPRNRFDTALKFYRKTGLKTSKQKLGPRP